MSEPNDDLDNKGAGGAPDDAAGGGKSDTVSHESYQKVLDQKKSFQSKYEEQQAEMQKLKEQIENAELEKAKAREDQTEYIKKLEEKLEGFKENEANRKKKATLSKVQQSFKSLAEKEGCKNVDHLLVFASSKLKEVKVNPENGNFDEDDIKTIVESAKKENDYLFASEGKGVDDIQHTKPKQEDYISELRKCKTQKELDEVRKKFGRL